MYSVKELATILGCSLTAVNKKIKADENNPSIKRYRNRYKTVVENNVTYILLDDYALEEEKRKSKGFKTGFTNVTSNGLNEYESPDYIEVEPPTQADAHDKIFDFTERYIERYTTLQKTFYDEMREKDKQIFLLTTSENQKEAEYFETKALNKQLTKQNNVLKVVLTVVATLLLTLLITFIITFVSLKASSNGNAENVTLEQPAETVQQPVAKPRKRTY